MSKKKVLAMFLASTMVVSLAGCSGNSKKDVTESAATEVTTTDATQDTESSTAKEATTDKLDSAAEGPSSDVTLTFMASQDWIQDAEMELAQKFTEQTGIKIDYQIVPSDQYQNLLVTKLNTGECTDLFAIQSGKFDIVNQYNVEKNALDLSDASWAKNVDELAATELTAGGKLYGQPIQDLSAVWAIAYNKEIFEKLSIDIPTDYASFDAACEKILASGITPVYESVSDGWHHVLWFPEICVQAETTTPGTADKLNNNEETFAGNKIMTTILEQMKDMIAKGYWGDNYMANTYADSAKNIASGEYAMTLANQGFGAEVNTVDPAFSEDQIGYFVVPLADNQTLNMNPAGPGRIIFSGSQHPEEAKQYLDFLATEESLTYLTENVPKFNQLSFKNAPSTYSDNVKEFYERYDKKETVYQTAVKYVNPQWVEIGSSLSAMFLDEMTPEEVLKEIDKVRAEQAKAADDPAWK